MNFYWLVFNVEAHFSAMSIMIGTVIILSKSNSDFDGNIFRFHIMLLKNLLEIEMMYPWRLKF